MELLTFWNSMCNEMTLKLFIDQNKNTWDNFGIQVRIPHIYLDMAETTPRRAPNVDSCVMRSSFLHGWIGSATRMCSFLIQFPASLPLFSTTLSSTFRPLFRCHILSYFPLLSNLKHPIILVRRSDIKRLSKHNYDTKNALKLSDNMGQISDKTYIYA